MSTNRTDQIPEVSGDESALVPPQSAPKAEWPKKIRTLTAAELDRLTIDAEGRFLWDGKVVNYEGPQALETKAPEMQNPEPKPTESKPAENETIVVKPVDPFDQIAAEIMESTRFELSDRKPPEPVRAAEPVMPAETIQLADEIKRVEETKRIDAPKPAEATKPLAESTSVDQFTPAVPMVADLRAIEPMRTLPALPLRQERIRVRLSGWQSLGLIVVILSLLVGAAGVAALGLVAANDWSCRVGLTARYCPLPPPAPPTPPPRAEIPA